MVMLKVVTVSESAAVEQRRPVGAINIEMSKKRKLKPATMIVNGRSVHSEEHALEILQELHNQYQQGLITDKAAYKSDREKILRYLSNVSINKLISEASNIYLKNYYASFLK